MDILGFFEHNAEKKQLGENPEQAFVSISYYLSSISTLQGQKQPCLFNGRKQKESNAAQIYSC